MENPRATTAILRTLAFYELFGVGRTAKQLAPYLLNVQLSRQDVQKQLTKLETAQQVVRVGAAYARSIESAKRTELAVEWAKKKRPIAARIAGILTRTPFVRMAALTQSVAMETAKASSDVDTFVVAAAGRLWTARFLALVRLKLAGIAKRHGTTADHGCFGLWADTTALDLSAIAVPNDIYLAFWTAHAVPIVNINNTYAGFVEANKKLLERFPNWKGANRESGIENRQQSITEWILGGTVGDWVEAALFTLQSAKIWRDDIAHRAGASVVATKHLCKLHHFDTRAELRDKWLRLTKKKPPRNSRR